MESRYLDGSSQRSPISVLTGFLRRGKEMFSAARAHREDPSSFDTPSSFGTRADTVRQGAPA